MKWRLPAGEFNVRTAPLNSLFSQLRRLDAKHNWIVTVEVEKRKRSLGQNARFHARCGELGTHVGYTQAEMKNIIKTEIGAYSEVHGPLGTIKRYESSAKWSAERMAHAIDTLDRFAAEVGYVYTEDRLL